MCRLAWRACGVPSTGVNIDGIGVLSIRCHRQVLPFKSGSGRLKYATTWVYQLCIAPQEGRMRSQAAFPSKAVIPNASGIYHLELALAFYICLNV
ncbi:hypothetical protein AB1N83_013069 [Pleurotus pulmonarius]